MRYRRPLFATSFRALFPMALCRLRMPLAPGVLVVAVLASFTLGSSCNEGERSACGNGTCDEIHGESMDTCAADCQLLCGNGACGIGERSNNCPADCFCGDGVCRSNEGETPSNCATDCASTLCGNLHCDWQYSENMLNCPSDCHSECCVCGPELDIEESYICLAECESGPKSICEAEQGETAYNCELDCADTCGDGQCAAGETHASCAADCGNSCGNGTCEPQKAETASSCGQDCAVCGDHVCNTPEATPGDDYCAIDCGCGNATCEPEKGETFANCHQDCHCGNGTCESAQGETTGNCPSDCTCGNGDCEFSIESALDCPADCDKPGICGNTVCDPNESDESCPPDCAAADAGVDADAPDSAPDAAGPCGEQGQPCCGTPSVPCAPGLACDENSVPLCVAADASAGPIDLVYCACVGAPMGVLATICADIPSCTSGMPAPDGSCDSVCVNGVVGSSCVPDAAVCN